MENHPNHTQVYSNSDRPKNESKPHTFKHLSRKFPKTKKNDQPELDSINEDSEADLDDTRIFLNRMNEQQKVSSYRKITENDFPDDRSKIGITDLNHFAGT